MRVIYAMPIIEVPPGATQAVQWSPLRAWQSVAVMVVPVTGLHVTSVKIDGTEALAAPIASAVFGGPQCGRAIQTQLDCPAGKLVELTMQNQSDSTISVQSAIQARVNVL